MKNKIEAARIKLLAEDVFEITADGWDGRVIKMTRRAFLADKFSLDRPAVYVLYADHFDKHTYGSELYVGHTSNATGRLDDHDAKKDYWTVVLVISSAGDWMNTAYTQNLEHTFIKWAKNANRYTVKNGTNGAPTHLGAGDMARLQEFEAGIRDVLRLGGIDVFEWNRQGVYRYEYYNSSTRVTSESRIVFDMNSIPPSIRILEGSEISSIVLKESQTTTLPSVSYDPKRQAYLFEKDVVVPVGTAIIIPEILGIHMTRWTNDFGKDAKEAFELLTIKK